MPKGNRPRGEKVTEQLGQVLKAAEGVKRGRPLKKSKFPKMDEVEAINTFLKERSGESYMRLAAMARDKKLRKNKPAIYVDIQKYIYEAGYPKKLGIEEDLNLPLRVVFELVKTPQQLESPKNIVEAQVIEIDDESIGAKKTDITDTTPTD